jgi:hypothetical protein
MRKEVPLILTAVSGLLVVVSQYFRFAQSLNWLTTANAVFQVASAVALPVGLVSLTIVHVHTVSRKRQGWPFSVLLLAATYVYTVSSLITGPKPGTPMTWLYTTVVSPASATLYGMVAFVITSACFRTFRFRSREASVPRLVRERRRAREPPPGLRRHHHGDPELRAVRPGWLGGARGAAEMENLLKAPGLGLASQETATIASVFILVLIVLGNVAYFGARRRKAA